MTAFLGLLARELRLGLRQGADLGSVLVFFVLSASLFPFGVGPEPLLLARIAAGIIWVTALLAAMLSLDRVFAADFEDGSLDQLALGALPLSAVVLAKAFAHWLVTGLPLIAIAPLLGLMLNLPSEGYVPLMAGMALGTPSLSLFGTTGAALTLGARRGSALISLLVLPLVLPVLIFGVGAVEAQLTGLGDRPYLLILGALFAVALPLGALGGAAALRQALE